MKKVIIDVNNTWESSLIQAITKTKQRTHQQSIRLSQKQSTFSYYSPGDYNTRITIWECSNFWENFVTSPTEYWIQWLCLRNWVKYFLIILIFKDCNFQNTITFIIWMALLHLYFAPPRLVYDNEMQNNWGVWSQDGSKRQGIIRG